MEICARNSNDIWVVSFVGGLIEAVNIDRTDELLVGVVLVHDFIIFDGCSRIREGESDHSEFVWGDIESDHIIEGAIKLAHAENLVTIQNNRIVHL